LQVFGAGGGLGGPAYTDVNFGGNPANLGAAPHDWGFAKKVECILPFFKATAARIKYLMTACNILMQEEATGVKVDRTGKTGFVATLQEVPKTAEDFIKKLNVQEHHYLLAIQLELQKATIMLKRSPRHNMVNTFNPVIARIWHGNCDMQLVLNGYAAANYVTKYHTKENLHVGKLGYSLLMMHIPMVGLPTNCYAKWVISV
jgi:hypothetical protein